MKKYRSYPLEFKQKLLAEIEGGHLSLTQAAREHQISLSVIEDWRKKHEEGRLGERHSSRERQLEQELVRCKKKIADLVLENDLLKKLRASSASPRRSSGLIVTSKKPDRSGGPENSSG